MTLSASLLFCASGLLVALCVNVAVAMDWHTKHGLRLFWIGLGLVSFGLVLNPPEDVPAGVSLLVLVLAIMMFRLRRRFVFDAQHSGRELTADERRRVAGGSNH